MIRAAKHKHVQNAWQGVERFVADNCLSSALDPRALLRLKNAWAMHIATSEARHKTVA